MLFLLLPETQPGCTKTRLVVGVGGGCSALGEVCAQDGEGEGDEADEVGVAGGVGEACEEVGDHKPEKR